MNDVAAHRRIVRIVADGLLNKEPEPAITAKLIAAGVPQRDASRIYADVKAACQRGVLTAFARVSPSPADIPPDPLLAEAFHVGYTNMRRAERNRWWRPLLLIILVLCVIALVIWRVTT